MVGGGLSPLDTAITNFLQKHGQEVCYVQWFSVIMRSRRSMRRSSIAKREDLDGYPRESVRPAS